MRFLVSGASGLIGQALCRSLATRGDEVLRLARPASTATSGSIAWDPAAGSIDLSALEAVGPIDGVVHLAGAGIAQKRWTTSRKQEILSSRILSTSTLVEALGKLEHRPSVLISASAIGFYGSRADEVLDEQSSAGDGFLAEVCRRWEAAAEPASDLGIRTVLARTGIVLSPGGGALAKQLPLFRLGLGGRLSVGSQWMSWIELGDEVAAIEWLLDRPDLSGPVNLTAPQPVTNAAFTDELARELHRPAFLAVPAPALRLALGRELVDEALLASQRVLPAVLLGSGFDFRAPDLAAGIRAATA
jgi:uncharacterized protein (TIGR01777 family)